MSRKSNKSLADRREQIELLLRRERRVNAHADQIIKLVFISPRVSIRRNISKHRLHRLQIFTPQAVFLFLLESMYPLLLVNISEDQHKLPFNGIIDWFGFAHVLREISFDGVLSLESGDYSHLLEPLFDDWRHHV